MRNKLFNCLVILITSLWLIIANAAEFTATVENNQLTFGQSVQLKLELLNAKATSGLDIAILSKDFTIYYQQQYSSYSNINGTVRAENGWLVTLMPKNPGTYQIPAISIYTDKGILTSQPIKVEVANAKSGSVADKDNIGISIVATANKTKAYVNEPIIYTLKIISYKPIANVVLDDVKSNDALIEKLGDPIQKDQSHGGMLAHIIEIRYAVTGLKAGKISIPGVRMNGELQVPKQISRNQRYSLFNNMMFDNMVELKPFSLESEEISINILPPVGKTTDWLPLHSFNMTQTWDIPKDVKVGDTITRKVKMVGKGGFAKQLPSIKESLQIPDVKIYANKPTFSDKFIEDGNTILGVREEEFSMVAQKDGSITIPDLEIKWWNLKTKQFETSTLQGKNISIAPLRDDGSSVTVDFSNEEPQEIASIPKTAIEQQQQTVLYTIVGALIGIVATIILFFIGVVLKKRFKNKKDKAPKELNKVIVINSVEDLRQHIIEHAVKVWHLETVSLNRLGDALIQKNYQYDLELYTQLTRSMNDALYADANLELAVLLEQWQAFKISVVKLKGSKDKITATEDYSSLNPT